MRCKLTLVVSTIVFVVTSVVSLVSDAQDRQPEDRAKRPVDSSANVTPTKQSELPADDDLPWRTASDSVAKRSVSNIQSATVTHPQARLPNVAAPIPNARQVPVRSAGFTTQAQPGIRQQVPAQLIPTQPTRPLAQLIPNAVPPYPVYPASQANVPNEPQLFLRANQFPPDANPVRTQIIQDAQVQPVSGQEPSLGAGAQPLQSDVTDSGITRVKKGIDSLPNEAGQVWREYDISPYTYAIENSARPQQAIIDWILKETGEELWFNEPLGILSANKQSLRVYHTPQIQRTVKTLVDRFVYGKGRKEVIGMRLVTISNPSWRTVAYSKMQPISVRAAGVEGWLINKENAAILINELSRRNDFKQHSGGDVVAHDGQTYNLSSKRPIQFKQSIRWVNSGGFVYAEPVVSQFNEGFSLDFSSLSSIDKRSCEVIIKCEVDQIERLQKVKVDVPTSTGQTQGLELQIPQMVSWKIHERFRWPADQVLLLSCGVVATPGPQANNMFNFNSLLNGSRRRADALLFIEYKGPAQSTLTSGQPATANIPVVGR